MDAACWENGSGKVAYKQLEEFNLVNSEAKPVSTLHNLGQVGLSQEMMARPIMDTSGGWKLRDPPSCNPISSWLTRSIGSRNFIGHTTKLSYNSGSYFTYVKTETGNEMNRMNAYQSGCRNRTYQKLTSHFHTSSKFPTAQIHFECISKPPPPIAAFNDFLVQQAEGVHFRLQRYLVNGALQPCEGTIFKHVSLKLANYLQYNSFKMRAVLSSASSNFLYSLEISINSFTRIDGTNVSAKSIPTRNLHWRAQLDRLKVASLTSSMTSYHSPVQFRPRLHGSSCLLSSPSFGGPHLVLVPWLTISSLVPFLSNTHIYIVSVISIHPPESMTSLNSLSAASTDSSNRGHPRNRRGVMPFSPLIEKEAEQAKLEENTTKGTKGKSRRSAVSKGLRR
ncbi:hypothetical protein BKA70DRAFT_1225457 [Coprinopsis sp. MPI-PUGE-AT-0042]|nr:hypothetical protein BKA70DRAFT_1225457 [Coprinopsis sp. MPI-PUGE-AT-0042]